jgi:hypothetical protein
MGVSETRFPCKLSTTPISRASSSSRVCSSRCTTGRPVVLEPLAHRPTVHPTLTLLFAGDVLEQMEYRHDWATFPLTADHFRYVLTQLIPDVIFHSEGQDEDQVRDHYDRGDDFYEWFLGPRM